MKIFEKFNLKSYNAYHLNASCAKVYFPETEEDLFELYQYKFQSPEFTLGNGNNTILSKDWYDESFIIFNGCFDRIEVNSREINAETGATMLQLSEIALQNSLSGFEIYYDIPSSVGGAVVMNAGAGSEEIKDLVVKVRYLDTTDLQIKEITAEDIGFKYRDSFFQRNPDKIVLKAWFNLTSGDPVKIRAKMEEKKRERWAKQPREYPNCGSVFKRPPGRFVGPMLDELGLKGFKIGGAEISEKHSGFIVNKGDATGKDIIELINYVRIKVKERFDVDLKTEQKIV